MYAKGTRSIWNGQDKHAKAENSDGTYKTASSRHEFAGYYKAQ